MNLNKILPIGAENEVGVAKLAWHLAKVIDLKRFMIGVSNSIVKLIWEYRVFSDGGSIWISKQDKDFK